MPTAQRANAADLAQSMSIWLEYLGTNTSVLVPVQASSFNIYGFHREGSPDGESRKDEPEGGKDDGMAKFETIIMRGPVR